MARYKVTLSDSEIQSLNEIAHSGMRSARTVLYARALLLLDQGEHAKASWKVDQVATAVGLTDRTLEHLKERFVKFGLDSALERKAPVRPSRKIIFDGAFAARLTQLACSEPPDGFSRWTVRLLADQLVKLEIVPSVSTMTVCNTLKKMNFILTSANTGKSRRSKIVNS